MAKDTVATATAREGVVSPAIEDLATHAACRITVPNGHAEAALQGHPKERRGDMCIDGHWGGRKPGTSPRGTTRIEVEAAGPGKKEP